MRQFSLSYTFILLLFAAQLFAQNTLFTLNGNLTDIATGQALAGAAVVIQGTYLGAATDAGGNFSISGLKQGTYQVQASLLGYQSQTQVLTINANQQVFFYLQSDERLLDAVLVSAVKANPNTATTYTNLDKSDISLLNRGQDIPFVLQQTPSVVVTSDAGAGIGYTGMRIRGTDATRINITLNGIPINDAESHSVFWVNMPDMASSLEDLQIQRGVGTSTNGAGAFGASVNMQSNKLNPQGYGQLHASAGSFNTQRYAVLFGSGLIDDKFTIDGRLSSITSAGYVDRASSDLKSFFLSGAYYGKKNTLKATVFWGHENTYQAWGGVPEELLNTQRTYNVYTYNNQVDNYQQQHYQLHYSHNLSRYWRASAALHYTKGAGYYEEYQPEQSFADYGLQNTSAFQQQITGQDTVYQPISTTDLVRRKWLDNDFYGTVFTVNYEKDKLNTTIGGGGNHYQGEHFGEVIWAQYAANGTIRHRYYENSGNKYDANVFWKTEYQINSKWGLFTDLQFRFIDYKIAGSDEDKGAFDFDLNYQFFNPKAGITYSAAPNQKLYASVGIAHREPTRSNLIDNDELPTSEQLRNVELGYRYSLPRFSLNANYYLMHYKNQLVLTGNLNDVGYPVQQNVPVSYRTGFELNGNLKAGSKIEIQANVTTSINKIKTFTQLTGVFDNDFNYLRDTLIAYQHTDIAFSPDFIANANINYQPFKQLTASFMTNYVSRQFLDNTSNPDRTLKPYFFSNLLLTYNLQPKWSKNIELSLLVNNLFNSLYESNGWTYFLLFEQENGVSPQNYNHYYPQAGINFLAGLKLEL